MTSDKLKLFDRISAILIFMDITMLVYLIVKYVN
jgi:hypothetical protein